MEILLLVRGREYVQYMLAVKETLKVRERLLKLG